jgi:hypothetical protein
MKNIQAIDGGANCSFSIYLASDHRSCRQEKNQRAARHSIFRPAATEDLVPEQNGE